MQSGINVQMDNSTHMIECIYFYMVFYRLGPECMYFYIIPVTWAAQCMHFQLFL